ncbi:hypothetical protein Dsin_010822 [Dipteronia sinensis]|uniref:Brix domain-containing protein n=1 Tax=Dipteronia sinensis TaxID=43782 RepID=A0AAE0AUF1_9ROSI|nr:hypothetical protein Dsin_010822 [Dipteronia sinensis]
MADERAWKAKNGCSMRRSEKSKKPCKGKPIPTELRNEEAALRAEIDLEDENTAVPKTHIDDEYANATERDPKILLTTSRNPSAPLTQFVKELKIVFPNAQRMNRGGQVISEIIETCRAHDFTDVVLVHEHRGVPDGLIISHLPFGPTAYFGLLNVVTRHDIKDKKAMGTMPEAYPHLILNNFKTKLGERTVNILKHLFPVPKPDTKRIITFANQSDYISFRHHIYEKSGGPKSIELKEIGPRFELRLYQLLPGKTSGCIGSEKLCHLSNPVRPLDQKKVFPSDLEWDSSVRVLLSYGGVRAVPFEALIISKEASNIAFYNAINLISDISFID